jgi:hypothetical protein
VFVGWSGSHLDGKRFADDEEVEIGLRKWLRQQSKDFYAAGFDVLVKRWDKCSSNITYFTLYIHFWPIYWVYLVKIRSHDFVFDPENVGDTILRNVCKLLQSYTVLQPISSHSWEPSILGLILEGTCVQHFVVCLRSEYALNFNASVLMSCM